MEGYPVAADECLTTLFERGKIAWIELSIEERERVHLIILGREFERSEKRNARNDKKAATDKRRAIWRKYWARHYAKKKQRKQGACLMSDATRAERLHAIVAKVWPAAMAQHAKDGSWPNRIEQPREGEHSGAPYVITTLQDGGRRIQVHSADGDLVGAQGANLDEALASLAAKVGVGDAA